MLKQLLTVIALTFSSMTFAVPITWNLVDFEFEDGGTAHGSFIFDGATLEVSNIDIYTTAGSYLSGRHYIAPAGDGWGAAWVRELGQFAFSDTNGPDLTNAGWLLLDLAGVFEFPFPAEVPLGTIVDLFASATMESFCEDYGCSSTANEITNPGESRNLLSGYLVAGTLPTAVSEPPTILLLGGTLIACMVRRKRGSRV